jgi:hypothetical protein
MTNLSTRYGGRCPKSAKARSRGRLGTGGAAGAMGIRKCRATIPILGNVQLTRWLTEPRCHQHGCHLRPCDALLADRQQPLA